MAKAKKKPAAKKAAPKKVAAPKAIKAALTKSSLLSRIAEENEISRKQAAGVLASIEGALLGCVMPNSVGQFVMPGLFKVTLRKVPARKAGTLIRNPATGEMMKAAAKPATVRVKVRALKKLKAAAVG